MMSEKDSNDMPMTFSIMNQQRRSRYSFAIESECMLSQNEKSFNVDKQSTKIPITKFITGSTYEGEWDILGMTGFGTYTFPHGVEYEGDFRDGEFHGEGTLIYPMGQRVYGVWSHGKLLSWTYQFKDGLEFDQSWAYNVYPDRRFYLNIINGLNPAGKELLTNDLVPRKIPQGCLDAGNGFYHPENKYIFSVKDHKRILGIPFEQESKWILENCRKAWDEPTGCNPDLYPDWTTGRSKSVTKLFNKFIEEEQNDSFAKIFTQKPQKHIQIS